MQKMIVVVNGDELGGGLFGIIEYDIEKRHVSFHKAPDLTLTPILEFGGVKKIFLKFMETGAAMSFIIRIRRILFTTVFVSGLFIPTTLFPRK